MAHVAERKNDSGGRIDRKCMFRRGHSCRDRGPWDQLQRAPFLERFPSEGIPHVCSPRTSKRAREMSIFGAGPP